MLGAVGTGDRWKKYDFIGKAKLWFAISGVIIVLGAISLATTGLNKGIDFTGGSKFDFNTEEAGNGRPVSSAASAAAGSRPEVQGVTSTRSPRGDTYTQFQVESHFLTAAAEPAATPCRGRSWPTAASTCET